MKDIQGEYQKYTEQVRAEANSAVHELNQAANRAQGEDIQGAFQRSMERVQATAQGAVDETFPASNRTAVTDIEDEYRRNMEQVRAKAQSAIDEVNQAFEATRAFLSDLVEANIREMDKQFFGVLPQLQQPPTGQDVRLCFPQSMCVVVVLEFCPPPLLPVCVFLCPCLALSCVQHPYAGQDVRLYYFSYCMR